MLGKFCGVPKNQPDVCPNVGWGKDFYDPQTLLDSTFNPAAIKPENNSNYPQLDDPKLEKAFDDAAAADRRRPSAPARTRRSTR